MQRVTTSSKLAQKEDILLFFALLDLSKILLLEIISYSLA
jgi:hypothetical protein